VLDATSDRVPSLPQREPRTEYTMYGVCTCTLNKERVRRQVEHMQKLTFHTCGLVTSSCRLNVTLS
jgi:hypothetical protein